MNANLQRLLAQGEIGFEDVFELYAQMCVNHTREITNDMIADEGFDEFVKQTGDVTVERMTVDSVVWAINSAPEMIGDIVPGAVRKEGEPWLNFVIRAHIEQYVSDSKSFRVELT